MDRREIQWRNKWRPYFVQAALFLCWCFWVLVVFRAGVFVCWCFVCGCFPVLVFLSACFFLCWCFFCGCASLCCFVSSVVVFLPVCLSVSVCLSLCVYVCPSILLYFCPSICPSIYVCLSISFPSNLYLFLTVNLSSYLSTCLPCYLTFFLWKKRDGNLMYSKKLAQNINVLISLLWSSMIWFNGRINSRHWLECWLELLSMVIEAAVYPSWTQQVTISRIVDAGYFRPSLLYISTLVLGTWANVDGKMYR